MALGLSSQGGGAARPIIFIRASNIQTVERKVEPAKADPLSRPDIRGDLRAGLQRTVRPDLRTAQGSMVGLSSSPIVYLVDQTKSRGPVDFSDLVTSFSYEDEEKNKADLCQITIDNHDLSQFDNPLWRKGAILYVSWGYPGHMSPERRVVIHKIRGNTTLRIEAAGPEIIMHRVKLTRVWKSKTLKEIADEIVGTYKGIFPEGTGETVPKSMTEHLDRLQELKGELPPTKAGEPAELSSSAKRNLPLVRILAEKWGPIFGVPVQMILTIAYIESRFRPSAKNTNARAMSRGGAWGVVQMTLFTARELVSRLIRSGLPERNATVAATLKKWDGSGPQLLDPDLCLMLGTFMLGGLWARFGGDPRKVSAAYHSGSKPVLAAERDGVDVLMKLRHYGKQYVGLTVRHFPEYASGGAGVPVMIGPAPAPEVAVMKEPVEVAEGEHGDEPLLLAPPDVEPPPDIKADLKTVFTKPDIRGDLKRDLAKRMGLPGRPRITASSIKLTQAHQAGETDAEFLKRISEAYGFVFYVDHEGFHLKRYDEAYDEIPSKVITWYAGEGDWLDFEYEDDATLATGKAEGKGLDPLTGKVYEAEGSNDATKRSGLAPNLGEMKWKLSEIAIAVKDLEKQAKEVNKGLDTPDSPEITKLKKAHAAIQAAAEKAKPGAASDEADQGPSASSDPELAKAAADGSYMKNQAEVQRLSGRVVGDPTFFAKSVMMCLGIGRRLSGRWRVTSVEHTIDRGGYTCSFKASRDGDNGFGRMGDNNSKANLNKKDPVVKWRPDEIFNKVTQVWDSPADAKPAPVAPGAEDGE